MKCSVGELTQEIVVMRILKSHQTVLAVAATLAMATAAWATGITHKYPGQACVRKEDNTTRPYYYGLSAKNDSGSVGTVYCPIKNVTSFCLDEPTEEWQTCMSVNTIAATAKVEDWSGTSNVECNLKVCLGDSSSCTVSDTESSSGSSGTVQTLTFDLSAANLAIDGDDVAYILCNIPAKTGGGDRSGVVSYSASLHVP
jgi:hypothetical protein